MAVLNWAEAEWHALLTTAQFDVLRKSHDERRGSHPLINETARGLYVCAACYSPLFESVGKFYHRDHPSFYEPEPGALEVKPAMGTVSMAYYCAHCGGYQGQVYNDGPQPTGKRYANNGEALLFVPRGQKPPPRRTER